MKNCMDGLPKGFYDIVGYDAIKQTDVIKRFFRVGTTYGYELVYPSEVGFENTYLSFGTAAHGRSYAFEDMGHNKLMLSSDSLASCIRAYLSTGHQMSLCRMMAKVPVFRYRHKKYRRWNHLIYTIFQESDVVLAVLSLLYAANDLLTKYYSNLTYVISLYGLFEEYASILCCTHEQMYDAIYSLYEKNQDQDNEIFKFLMSIRKLGKEHSDWRKALEAIAIVYPQLFSIIEAYKDFFVALDYAHINFYIDWEHYHAVEYSSGICFLIKDDNGSIIADGGSYSYLVHKLNSSITYCYSFACSLEDVSKHVQLVDSDIENNILYLIRIDCSIVFFEYVCAKLRSKNYKVYELQVEDRIKNTLKKLPTNSVYILVGEVEETCRKIWVFDKLIDIDQ